MFDDVSSALEAAGIEHGKATRSGLEMGITVVPVSVVKGLSIDDRNHVFTTFPDGSGHEYEQIDGVEL